MKPIMIASHWHTGSSLLAKAFAICGMSVGNEKTFWNETCLSNTEHYLFNNTIAAVVNNEHKNIEENIEQIGQILKSYKQEAAENNWKFYGLKITHLLQAWDVFGPVIKECWPDAVYVIGIQHPLRIAKTLQAKPHGAVYSRKELHDYVAASFINAYTGIDDLLKTKSYIIDYPTAWNARVKTIINKIGLKYNKDVEKMFKENRNYTLGKIEKEEFEKKYPEATKRYYDLIKYAK